MNRRTLLLILAVALVVTVLLWTTTSSDGLFNIDELHYALAAQRFAEHGDFLLPNGYAQHRSPLLLYLHPLPLEDMPAQAEMTSFIPPLYIFPAALFYRLGGISGLRMLEAMSFVLCVVLMASQGAWLAKREGMNPQHGAWLGAGLFLGAGFFLDYGTAVINHLLTLALALGALAAHPLRACEEKAPKLAATLLCGLLAGCAIGVRLQEVITAFVLGAGCLLLSGRERWRHAAAYALGVLPPLALMSWVNHERFGVWNPFSYGITTQSRLIPVIGRLSEDPLLAVVAGAVALGLLVAAGAVLRRRWNERLARWTPLALGVATLVVLLLPPFREHFQERVLGLAPFHDASGMWLGLDPLLVFWTGERNALLSSTPVLGLALVLPFLPRSVGGSRMPWLLGGLLWGNVLFLCLMRNNGGFFFNQRYFIPAAAFGMLLAVAPVLRIFAQVPLRWLVVGGGVALIFGVALLYVGTPGTIWPRAGGQGMVPALSLDGWPDRVLPALAAVVLAVAGAVALWKGSAPRWALAVAGVLLPVCLFSPLVLHLFYDAPATHEYRESNAEMQDALRHHLPDGSLVILAMRQREPVGRLAMERDIWIADAQRLEGEALRDQVRRLLWALRESGDRAQVFATAAALRRGLLPDLAMGFRFDPIPGAPLGLHRVHLTGAVQTGPVDRKGAVSFDTSGVGSD